MPSNNQIVIASAGSRKTTFIVKNALEQPIEASVLILAYTNNTLSQVRKYIIDRNGYVPKNITIQSWHSFLLSECIKPYQNAVYERRRIEHIFYPTNLGEFKKKRKFINKTNTEKYFLINSKYIISEHLSEFALKCNSSSEGLVIDRLEKIYDNIFVDESQDLAGYDFQVIESLLVSNIAITLVGDCRQATYSTNNSTKNKRFKGSNIIDLFKQWEIDGLCSLVEKNECFRSNQAICDFGDKLYPELSPTISRDVKETHHDGLFLITESDIELYCENHSPIILRDSVKTDTLGYPAFNFGAVKGLTFERVLIFPNGPIKKYLKHGNLEEFKPITKAKFYVGITRARNSVAIVYDGKSFLNKN